MRRSTKSELVFGLALVLAVVGIMALGVGLAFGDEKPLTHAEALAKVAAWGPDATADKVVVLDWLLREDPLVTLPLAVYALKGRDLAIGWDPPWIRVELSSPFAGKAPPLDFKILLPAQEKKGFAPRLSPWPAVAGVIVAALGAVVADELLPLPPFVKQAAAVGCGGAAGLLTWWLWPG